MSQSLYSLRWNNHQNHMLSSFESLLQNETLVDVTLVCSEISIRAHKVVLSACSPFFQKIFSENPCKHPVIVLKDFQGWEVQTIVDFMYKGEVSIAQEQIQTLIKAAESLQVRGLVSQDQFAIDKESTSITNQTPTPSNSPSEFDRSFFTPSGRFPTPGVTVRTPTENASPFSPIPRYSSEPSVKLAHMAHLQFQDPLLSRREDCHSPVPRRKQSRPRRRSGDLSTPQDLSTTSTPKPATPTDETAENLCLKKPRLHEDRKEENSKTISPEPLESPELDLSLHSKDFTQSPPLLPNVLKMNHEMDSPSPLSFPPMPSVSALAMSQPHNKFFGLDSPLLFPPGMDGVRNPLLDMADPRATPESHLFAKKKMGRPKGQHSAPRGGPPRSWTNAELTEALQQVWNKKMTTSQASRVYGIPYNSLLMYVRGKYGKSLKLEKLREGCQGGPQTLIDVMQNNQKAERDSEHIQQNTRPSSTEDSQQPMYNHFPAYFPEFAPYPVPVNLVHLLPQSEKNSDGFRQQLANLESQESAERVVKDEPQDMFISPTLSREERRELVQQNGQD